MLKEVPEGGNELLQPYIPAEELLDPDEGVEVLRIPERRSPSEKAESVKEPKVEKQEDGGDCSVDNSVLLQVVGLLAEFGLLAVPH